MPSSTIYTDGTYAAQNAAWHVEDSPWKARQILKALTLSGLRPTSMAEIGCGRGEILNQLSNQIRDCRFEGFDISLDAISKAASNSSVKFRVGSIQDMGFYDLVLGIDVLEHVEDVFGFLRDLRGHGKSFIFHIPLDMTAYGLLRGIPNINRRAFGHLHYFSRDTALSTLVECGYAVSHWFYTPTIDTWPKSPINAVRKILFALNEDIGAKIMPGYSVMAVCR
jgi:cyclopropane fatty-acyl-phospholipid synthase-like methyltransferase